MGHLPVVAKRGILGPLRIELAGLQRSAPQGVIPVTRDGWEAVIEDASLDAAAAHIDGLLDDFANPAYVWDTTALRSASERLVGVIRAACEDLWCLDAMLPAEGRGAIARDALIEAGVVGLDRVAGVTNSSDLAASRAKLKAAFASISSSQAAFTFPDDVCLAAFGVAYAELLDSAGVFSVTRLLGSYYGRYDELMFRVRTILSVITASPPDLLNALHPVEALVLSERPLIALRTAVRVHDLLLSKLNVDAEALAEPLRELKLSVDRSASSHAGMIRAMVQLTQATTDADRASLTLDIYRRMAEGQLRPWAWTLLRVYGRTFSRAPELASLREQLLAHRLPLLSDAAQAILPAARNAAAHEDYLWNEDDHALHVGESKVSLDDLERATAHAYSFVAGAECAWTCARRESPLLARLLDAEDPPTGLPAINKLGAIAHFGTNGLLVRNWHADRGVLNVELDELPHNAINPCFQAVMWASRHLDTVERFVVTLPGRPLPAMDLSRVALDATFIVWREAVITFTLMPLSTFLPANMWSRLAVEVPDQAAQAVAWLAVNDALHAYLDAQEASGRLDKRVGPLVARLQLISTAVAATMATLPLQAVGPLTEVLDTVRAAASANLAAAHGLSAAPAAYLERRIHDLYDSWPVAAVLPTVDPRPLDQIDP